MFGEIRGQLHLQVDVSPGDETNSSPMTGRVCQRHRSMAGTIGGIKFKHLPRLQNTPAMYPVVVSAETTIQHRCRVHQSLSWATGVVAFSSYCPMTSFNPLVEKTFTVPTWGNRKSLEFDAAVLEAFSLFE